MKKTHIFISDNAELSEDSKLNNMRTRTEGIAKQCQGQSIEVEKI